MQLRAWGMRGGGCASAKVQEKMEWQIDALSKMDFCLGPEVTGSNSLVSDPWPGCSGPCPTRASA